MLMETDTLGTIESAVTQGIETCLVARKAKVPEFVEKYFSLCEQFLVQIRSKADCPEFREKPECNLAEYAKTRIAVTELAGSLISLATSYTAFQKALPGVFSTGMASATAIAQHMAVANFWLGSTIGAWYYGLFPASASINSSTW